MSHNALVTGPPRSGKTTAIERAVDRLRADGYAVGGIASPEIRENGDRVGFEIIAVDGDAREVMAHVQYDEPTVGKYGVDAGAIDRLAKTLESATDEADCVVVDEIAPMQLESERFVSTVEEILESPVPTLAAIADGDRGVLGEVKSRSDVETFGVTDETRDELPEQLVAFVEERL
ncbi:nucleoside-triphosphatase [Natronobacterium texcoconense]|uniref:Nucleoside-triphosphatase SAMN04489842_2695 n=1 Tax=Natronobacterium texcoconense TaxID=1095778 RepID=A0A1H1GZ67_NATTX|nr:nucleoside-triphosphatase [Natronobacterium texcoconense]